MKKKTILLAALAVVLLLSVSVGSALGFFTDHDEASGERPIVVKPWTYIRESFKGWIKEVVITNYTPSDVDEGAPCYVRARAYMVGNEDGKALEISGNGWTGSSSNDWYYYGEILKPGPKGVAPEDITDPACSTTGLKVEIKKIPVEEKVGESFNVIVVYEAAPVLYNAAGTPYADWSQAIVLYQTGG